MSPKQRTRFPVSSRALLQRINRALKNENEMVKKCRESSRSYHNLGDYYKIDTYRNFIVDTHVNLEYLAKKLRIMGAWETLADE